MKLDFNKPFEVQYQAEMPSELLSLRYSELGYRTCEELVASFNAIPPCVTKLDLGCTSLDKKNGEELAKVFKAIPPSVTTLDLSSNFLGDKTGEELTTVLKAIPLSVTKLDLSGNHLYKITGEELATVFKAIPSSVTKLDLSVNHFGNKTRDGLAMALKAIPLSVTELALIGNFRNNKTVEKLVTSFKAIPPSVTKLNLDGGDFGKRTGDELAKAFKAVPSSVTELDLSRDYFFGSIDLHLMDINQLIIALLSLPDTVRKVNLGRSRITQRSIEEQNQLRRALADKPFFLEGNGSDIQPSTVGALAQVIPIPPLQDIILSYLMESGETLPRRHTALAPIQAGFFMSFISHPVTKIISALAIVAGLIGIILAAFSVVGIAVAVASAASLVIGTGIVTAGFFANKKTSEETTINNAGLDVQPTFA